MRIFFLDPWWVFDAGSAAPAQVGAAVAAFGYDVKANIRPGDLGVHYIRVLTIIGAAIWELSPGATGLGAGVTAIAFAILGAGSWFKVAGAQRALGIAGIADGTVVLVGFSRFANVVAAG